MYKNRGLTVRRKYFLTATGNVVVSRDNIRSRLHEANLLSRM